MSTLKISRSAILDPAKSRETDVRLELDLWCDGCPCGLYREYPEGGAYIEPPVHAHIISSGREPDAGPRCQPVMLDEIPVDYLESLF